MSTAAPGAKPGASSAGDQLVLSVRDLVISYRTGMGALVDAVRGVSFDLYGNSAMALVGESGCGKTTLGLGLLRLLPRLGLVRSGSLTYHDAQANLVNVLALSRSKLRRWRWAEAAMVFQGAMNSFNPVLSVGRQMSETIVDHFPPGQRASRREIADRVGDSLRAVRLEPRQVVDSYPHQLSGGMRQRALIAMSLLLEPRLLVLDEPTTALDILTQRSIIDLLAELRAKRGFAMIFISHDLALAAELADRVVTMYAGQTVESGTAVDIFYSAAHPYTSRLINAVPKLHSDSTSLTSIGGTPPSLASLPPACAFAPRCDLATSKCCEVDPPLQEIRGRSHDASHRATCWHIDQVHLQRKVDADG